MCVQEPCVYLLSAASVVIRNSNVIQRRRNKSFIYNEVIDIEKNSYFLPGLFVLLRWSFICILVVANICTCVSISVFYNVKGKKPSCSTINSWSGYEVIFKWEKALQTFKIYLSSTYSLLSPTYLRVNYQ